MRSPNRHKELRDCFKRRPSRRSSARPQTAQEALAFLTHQNEKGVCLVPTENIRRHRGFCCGMLTLCKRVKFAWPEPGAGGGEAE